MTTRTAVSLEWGPQGLRLLSETCECVVIVDVFSFSTSVAVAVARGAAVWPHSGHERAEELARHARRQNTYAISFKIRQNRYFLL